jgi:hypothetical protein
MIDASNIKCETTIKIGSKLSYCPHRYFTELILPNTLWTFLENTEVSAHVVENLELFDLATIRNQLTDSNTQATKYTEESGSQ